MNAIKRFAATVALGLASAASFAAPQTITWNGSSDFESEQISFAPFTANALTDITGPGMVHNHGWGPMTMSIGIHLDGSWVNLGTFSVPQNGHDFALADFISTPLTFAQGQVDGLMLSSDPYQYNSFHYFSQWWYGATQFTFDTVAGNGNAVPEPSSLALLAIGFVGIAAAARKKRSA